MGARHLQQAYGQQSQDQGEMWRYDRRGERRFKTGEEGPQIIPDPNIKIDPDGSESTSNPELADNVKKLHKHPNLKHFDERRIKQTRKGIKTMKNAAKAVATPTKEFIKNLGVASSGYLKTFLTSTSSKAAGLRTISFGLGGLAFGYLALKDTYKTIQLFLKRKKDTKAPSILHLFKAIWEWALAGGFLGPFLGIKNIFGEVSRDGVLDISTKSLLGGTVGWFLYSTFLKIAQGRSVFNKVEHALGQNNLQKIAGSVGDTWNYLATDEEQGNNKQGAGLPPMPGRAAA